MATRSSPRRTPDIARHTARPLTLRDPECALQMRRIGARPPVFRHRLRCLPTARALMRKRVRPPSASSVMRIHRGPDEATLLRKQGTRARVDREFDSILSVSRRHNAQCQLTGLLVYLNGGFMQVLEGPDQALELTLRRIAADERHEMLALWSGPITARAFPASLMGDARLGTDGGAPADFADIFSDAVTVTSVKVPHIDPMLRRFLNAFRACFHPSGMGP